MATHFAAFLLIMIGLPLAFWPYQIANFDEQIAAIGSKHSMSEVEPAGWNVALTRIMGIGATILGVVAMLIV